jgi:hypothetical protein
VRRVWTALRRATVADVAIVVAALALVAALLRPTLDQRALRARVGNAIGDVDLVMESARASRASQGRWPTASLPGEAPRELGLLATDGPFARSEYELAWTTWAVVDSMSAPPEPSLPRTPGDAPRAPDAPRLEPVTRELGAVAVHTGDEILRAALLAHYGMGASFVLDTMWMVVLPERSASGPVSAPDGGP